MAALSRRPSVLVSDLWRWWPPMNLATRCSDYSSLFSALCRLLISFSALYKLLENPIDVFTTGVTAPIFFHFRNLLSVSLLSFSATPSLAVLLGHDNDLQQAARIFGDPPQWRIWVLYCCSKTKPREPLVLYILQQKSVHSGPIQFWVNATPRASPSFFQ